MVKWIITAILFLPVAEIATFIAMAAFLGIGWTLLLMLATTAVGFLVLRQAGRGRIANFRTAATNRNTAGFEADMTGFLTVLAGLLLFLPGFLTDLAGALLLLKPVRRRVAASFQGMVMAGMGGTDRTVVDLDPDEWRQMPDKPPPRDRIERQ